MPKSQITKDTKLCISIAERPGNFGTILMNAAFAKQNIDFVYKATKVNPKQLKQALAGVRALNIRGCGVSMPFKMQAIPLLDSLDPWAKKIGAINTIVNTNGRLKGYNTDAYGAYQVLKTVKGISKQKVIMAGAGGVARALSAALAKLRVSDVTIVNRHAASAKELAKQWNFDTASWGAHEKTPADIFINATPIGMRPKPNHSPLTPQAIKNYQTIMDVVIYPNETKLLTAAKAANRRIISGLTMSLNQSARQYELYTGQKAPVQLMRKLITQVK